MNTEESYKPALFEGRQIRKAFHEGEWWFSIIDVVEALVGGDRPRKYWNDLKKKLAVEGYVEVSEKIGQLKMVASDGKQRLTDCANTETLFRVIQSIPSPKVEPLKRWLAKVGKERLDEIENPELAMGRMQGLYEKKGYPKEWIDKRLRGIAVRQDLIRTMRRMAGEAGLPLPEFASDRQKNEFKVTLFLHHLLTEDDYAWLKALAGEGLNGDEAKALIYARETGVVDNTACRDFSGLDTLQASSLLRRLRDRGLLEKRGAGSRTHYTLTSPRDVLASHPEQGELPLEGGNRIIEGGKRTLPDLPPELAARLPHPRQRLGEAALRALIRELCGWQALRGEELATLPHKDLKYLRNKHLTQMVQTGELAFLFPESPNHALQAYKLPARDQGQ